MIIIIPPEDMCRATCTFQVQFVRPGKDVEKHPMNISRERKSGSTMIVVTRLLALVLLELLPVIMPWFSREGNG